MYLARSASSQATARLSRGLIVGDWERVTSEIGDFFSSYKLSKYGKVSVFIIYFLDSCNDNKC
jgi:hypothetical protein